MIYNKNDYIIFDPAPIPNITPSGIITYDSAKTPMASNVIWNYQDIHWSTDKKVKSDSDYTITYHTKMSPSSEDPWKDYDPWKEFKDSKETTHTHAYSSVISYSHDYEGDNIAKMKMYNPWAVPKENTPDGLWSKDYELALIKKAKGLLHKIAYFEAMTEEELESKLNKVHDLIAEVKSLAEKSKAAIEKQLAEVCEERQKSHDVNEGLLKAVEFWQDLGNTYKATCPCASCDFARLIKKLGGDLGVEV